MTVFKVCYLNVYESPKRNGNILRYLRQGTGSGTAQDMDSLSYNYYNGTNHLSQVRDRINGSTSHSVNYTVDIENQRSSTDYGYDEIGNLIEDDQENINEIIWNVYGKITSIEKQPVNTGDAISINYKYDPNGNRVGKEVWRYGAPPIFTWYVRDAQGNVMAVYEKNQYPMSAGPLKLKEHHVYGSSRLGIIQRDLDMDSAKVNAVNANLVGPTYVYQQQRGEKLYELSNHLGNVLVTISDKKLGHDAGNGTYDYYTADVVNANDYYPFGMLMPGRKYSATNSYRYGFNGKENDNEVKGVEGSQQDYGFRIYDPRLGKFLSVDPLTNSYPWYTPYQFAGNKPIAYIDLDGLEEAPPKIPPEIPQISNPSESTCQGCAQRAIMMKIGQDQVNLENLKSEYLEWLKKPENQGKPVPPQYKNLFSTSKNTAEFKQGGYLGSKQYKLFKANYDTYGQYLPGPSDIVDGLTALEELSKGNYTGAAAAAFFLIPGADVFKPLKSLKGIGGELLESHLKKFGNQAQHLTKLDIEGAVKDIANNPIMKKSGKPWQHLKEVEEALAGVGNQLNKLTKDINNGKFTDEVLKQAETIRGTLQKQKDKLTDVLNEAKKNAQ